MQGLTADGNDAVQRTYRILVKASAVQRDGAPVLVQRSMDVRIQRVRGCHPCPKLPRATRHPRARAGEVCFQLHASRRDVSNPDRTASQVRAPKIARDTVHGCQGELGANDPAAKNVLASEVREIREEVRDVLVTRESARAAPVRRDRPENDSAVGGVHPGVAKIDAERCANGIRERADHDVCVCILGCDVVCEAAKCRRESPPDACGVAAGVGPGAESLDELLGERGGHGLAPDEPKSARGASLRPVNDPAFTCGAKRRQVQCDVGQDPSRWRCEAETDRAGAGGATTPNVDRFRDRAEKRTGVTRRARRSSWRGAASPQAGIDFRLLDLLNLSRGRAPRSWVRFRARPRVPLGLSWPRPHSIVSTRVHVVDFRAARDIAQLAAHAGCEKSLLERVALSTDRQQFYIRHEIPKRRRGAGTRTVWEAEADGLADAHKALCRRLDGFFRLASPGFPHTAAHGYIRGRGTRQNAAKHCGARLLLRADLRSFFESIPVARVEGELRKLNLAPIVAKTLAAFCTVDDVLALGLHTSPLLSNLVCMDLDRELEALANGLSCTYTRYADDISISGELQLPERGQLEEVVLRQGFTLSESKYRVTKRGQAHFVTGLSISDTVPHVPKRMKRRLRLELYYCNRFGVAEHLRRRGKVLQKEVNRLDGLIRYVSGIELQNQKQLRERWQLLLSRDDISTAYAARYAKAPRDLAFLVDESEFKAGNVDILALGLVSTQDRGSLREQVEASRREYLADPYQQGKPKKLETKGLHYADLHEAVRDQFVRVVAGQRFHAHIAFKALPSAQEYEATYLALLAELLPARLSVADHDDVAIIVETNPKVSIAKVNALISRLYGELLRTSARRPLREPEARSGGKLDAPELAVVDFALGVFGHYFLLHQGGNEAHRLRFERLRDKYRAIIDVDGKRVFGRRIPLMPFKPAGS